MSDISNRERLVVPRPDCFVRDGRKGILFSYFTDGERDKIFSELCEAESVARELAKQAKQRRARK